MYVLMGSSSCVCKGTPYHNHTADQMTIERSIKTYNLISNKPIKTYIFKKKTIL